MLKCAIFKIGCRRAPKQELDSKPAGANRKLVVNEEEARKNPPQLTALMRLALEIPIDWSEQRKLLGFHAWRNEQARVAETLTPKCRPRDFLGEARPEFARNCLCQLEQNPRARKERGIWPST